MSRLEEIRNRLRGEAQGKQIEANDGNKSSTSTGILKYVTRSSDSKIERGAGKKAIIIGNSSYEYGRLNGCCADAQAMSRFFSDIGYSVTCIYDATSEEMNLAFDEFESSITDSDESVIYFSGHGFLVNSEQYLQPIDNAPGNEHLLQYLYRSVNVHERIDRIMYSGSRMTLAIIDACRQQYRLDLANNIIIDPNGDCIPVFDIESGASDTRDTLRNSQKELTRRMLKGNSVDQHRKGIGIVYASSHNTSSVDSPYLSHGIFTAVFLQEAIVPGRTISEVVHIVRDKVIKQSRLETSLYSGGNNETVQAPSFYDSFDGDYYFIPPEQ